jgi:hypothetical protein
MAHERARRVLLVAELRQSRAKGTQILHFWHLALFCCGFSPCPPPECDRSLAPLRLLALMALVSNLAACNSELFGYKGQLGAAPPAEMAEFLSLVEQHRRAAGCGLLVWHAGGPGQPTTIAGTW